VVYTEYRDALPGGLCRSAAKGAAAAAAHCLLHLEARRLRCGACICSGISAKVYFCACRLASSKHGLVQGVCCPTRQSGQVLPAHNT